ncbi:hypothetical protein HI914_01247 [Erysiphe necator]|nr:hypothetical protein HI914_01247 [Erysiphe necator]
MAFKKITYLNILDLVGQQRLNNDQAARFFSSLTSKKLERKDEINWPKNIGLSKRAKGLGVNC